VISELLAFGVERVIVSVILAKAAAPLGVTS
jgi:hypothetical protein